MLIIFDCDGVLVDSEQLAAQVFSSALAEIGVSMPADECFSTFHGKTLNACYSWLQENKKISLPVTFANMLERNTQSRFAAELRSVEGIEQVLDYLVQKQIPFCVASNGGHKKIRHSLKTTGLLSYFEHLFSAQDVALGKPHPDLFLYAARKMNTLASNVLVIEDSISGVRAAISAGMEVLLYGSVSEEAKWQGLDKVVENFSQMSELVELIDNKFNELKVEA